MAAGPSLEGIAILNIPSYAGGTNPWGEVDRKKARKKSKKAKCNGKDENDWAEQGTAGLEGFFYFWTFKYTITCAQFKNSQGIVTLSSDVELKRVSQTWLPPGCNKAVGVIFDKGRDVMRWEWLGMRMTGHGNGNGKVQG